MPDQHLFNGKNSRDGVSLKNNNKNSLPPRPDFESEKISLIERIKPFALLFVLIKEPAPEEKEHLKVTMVFERKNMTLY